MSINAKHPNVHESNQQFEIVDGFGGDGKFAGKQRQQGWMVIVLDTRRECVTGTQFRILLVV